MEAHFGHIVDFPTAENREVSVSSIEGGYKFVFYSPDGEEIKSISISSKSVESLHQATGYNGDVGLAIEEFRKFGKLKWPERFK